VPPPANTVAGTSGAIAAALPISVRRGELGTVIARAMTVLADASSPAYAPMATSSPSTTCIRMRYAPISANSVQPTMSVATSSLRRVLIDSGLRRASSHTPPNTSDAARWSRLPAWSIMSTSPGAPGRTKGAVARLTR
jgi:hypothetical protein